jgi:hypothetical protein
MAGGRTVTMEKTGRRAPFCGLPLLVQMHPNVRRDLTRLGQLDHAPSPQHSLSTRALPAILSSGRSGTSDLPARIRSCQSGDCEEPSHQAVLSTKDGRFAPSSEPRGGTWRKPEFRARIWRGYFRRSSTLSIVARRRSRLRSCRPANTDGQPSRLRGCARLTLSAQGASSKFRSSSEGSTFWRRTEHLSTKDERRTAERPLGTTKLKSTSAVSVLPVETLRRPLCSA